jgi:RHS repeat-associated protein
MQLYIKSFFQVFQKIKNIHSLSKNSWFVWIMILTCILPSLAKGEGWDIFQMEESDFSPAGKEGLLSLLIDNKVSAISGEYIDAQEDLTLVGPETLRWQRYYSSSPAACAYGIEATILSNYFVDRRSHYCNWQFNYALGMYLQFETNGHARHLEATALVPHLSSANMVHKSLVSNKDFRHDCCQVTLDTKREITNCSMHEISAKTNPKNVVAIYNDKKKYCKISYGNGGYKNYRAIKFECDGDRKNDFLLYTLEPFYEKKPSGNQIFYNGIEVRAYNSTGNTLFSWIKHFLQSDNKIKVESSHFDPIVYTYEPLKVYPKSVNDQKTYYYLKSLNRPDQPDESYDYTINAKSTGWLLKRKNLPKKRFLEIEYYALGDFKSPNERSTISSLLDPRLDRVKCLRAPVGENATSIVTHRMYYNLNYEINEKKETVRIYKGATTVFDALNRKSIYSYDASHLLTSFKQYFGKESCKETKYLWQKSSTQELEPAVSLLLGKIELDEQKKILNGIFFKYDQKGNIISNRFYGSLTGIKSCKIELGKDKYPLKNEVECYEKTYRYSKDHFNLLMEMKLGNGKQVRYEYVSGTDLISQKLLMEKESVVAREFYEYDENNALIKLTRDNGSSTHCGDLTNVTIRRITYYSPRKIIPVGLFEQIEERALNTQTGEEILIRRTVQEFSKEGRLTKQKIYDAQGNFRYKKSWKYDAHGNPVKEVNALNHQTLRKYDGNDNLIQEYHVESHCTVDYSYDFSNRLVEEKRTQPNGVFYKHYKYDLVGNKISQTDLYDNETQFFYDDLNRLVEIHYPLIQTQQGVVVPSKKLEYDVQGNVIKETNLNGFDIKKSYNSRGQVTSILHPDGQVEKFAYHLDGSLAKKIASNGTMTCFDVDCFGRVLKESVFDANENFLYETTHSYDSFHKISSTDQLGLTTYFKYDSAGRLIEKSCADQVEAYEYDPLGRVCKKREPFEEGVKITCFEYDLLDRIIEERIENSAGSIHRKKSYKYDVWGNRTHIIDETKQGKCIQKTFFDADGKLLETVDPEKNKTHFSYNYTFSNHLNQSVLQTKKVDCLGRQTIIEHDAREMPVHIQLRDPYGNLLQSQDIFYDLMGNIISLIDHEILNGKEIQSIESSFEYQVAGQLACIIQAKNLPEKQITHIFYNSCGQKERVKKPDGTILNYTYDALGRLKSYWSSDQTLSYLYTYNNRNQVIQVKDQTHEASSTLTYDEKGRLIKEELANGIPISYHYDLLNRVIAIQLPQHHLITYEYDEVNLKKIKRHKRKKLLYSYSYEEHDLAGLNILAKTIDNKEITYAYDLSKRLLSSQSTEYIQKEAHYDAVGRLTGFQVEDTIGKFSTSFAYNDLDQLISEQGEHNHTYVCDSLHRRVCKDNTHAKFNGLHQLLSDAEFTYTYDLSGNLIKKQNQDKTILYAYDADSQLIGIQGDKQIAYRYDVFHRRLAKLEKGQKTLYLYIGQEEIASLNEAGEILELRILGEHPGTNAKASIALELEGKIYVPYHDFQGSIIALTDLGGSCMETYRYSAFGETTVYDAEKNQLLSSRIKNPWQFSNKRLDEESGFIYFGRRYYDPKNGRWITADPAGLIDGSNLYAYLQHHPVGSWDLYGLFEENHETPAYYPLENVDFNDDSAASTASLEINTLNQTGTDLVLKRSGKTGQSYSCGYIHNDFVSFLTIHGIRNTFQDAYNTAKQRSEDLNGAVVNFVFNESKGLILDVVRSASELFFHMDTDRVLNARTEIKDLLNETYYVGLEPHSEGGIVSRNAIRGLSRDEQKRIILVGFACAAYLNQGEVLKSKYYRSERDFVPFCDIAGFIRCADSIDVLKPHADAPLWDHTIASPTFRSHQRNEALKILKKYGEAE